MSEATEIISLSNSEHDRLLEHLTQNLGPVVGNFVEIIPGGDLVVGVLPIAPTSGRDEWTLVTAGMSALPMTVSSDAPEDVGRKAELVITLPSDWLDAQNRSLTDEHASLMGAMRSLARYVHENKTWLGPWHTVQWADGSEFSADAFPAAMLMPVQDELPDMQSVAGDPVQFLRILPLTPEELDIALSQGPEALHALFQGAGVQTRMHVPGRSSVRRKKRGLSNLFGLLGGDGS